jgi:hypothetical protein
MSSYRKGPYIVEEGFAMIDQDGEQAYQDTFAETTEQANELLLRILGFDRYEAERDLWRPGFAVRITDTNLDYPSRIRKRTVMPLGVWERYGDPYVF